jgi:CDP-diacylglycerol--glycerol-3-phosphate 3-phosphatidyltransferase
MLGDSMTSATPPKPPVLNLANLLTLSRLPLSVILFVFIEFHAWLLCLSVFVLAALTDWLDGIVARKYNLGTALGRLLDPLMDKVITCGSFVFLAAIDNTGLVPWMAVVVLSREFLITGLRGYQEQQGIPFGADLWGKIKMVLQCTALVVIFLVLAVTDWAGERQPWLEIGRDVLIWAMLAATIISGLNYCWRAKAVFLGKDRS